MKRTDVENVLMKMGMPVDLLGFDYIADGVLMIDSDPIYKHKFTCLYNDISKKYDTTYSGVERAIRHALQRVRDVGDIDVVTHYIGYMACTSKSSLFMLHKKIMHETSENQIINSDSEKPNEQEVIKKAIEIFSKNLNYETAKELVEAVERKESV